MTYTPVEVNNQSPIFLGSERMQQLFTIAPFRVPTYQRKYKWSTDDFEKLLKDLGKLHVSLNFEGVPDRKAHYMGNLFFFHENTTLHDTSFNIIDGQQRLTTCLIFLSIIFYELKIVLGYPDLADSKAFQPKYRNMRSKFHDLILKRYDTGFFSRFEAGHGELPLARFIMHLTNGQPHVVDAVYDFQDPCGFTPADGSDPENRFLESVKMAYKAMVTHVEKPAQGAFEHGGAETYSNNLLKLAVQIMDGLQFGVVTINNESDAYDVFVNINSTGKPLSHFEVFCARIDRKITYNIHNENHTSRIRGLLNEIQDQLSYKDGGETDITKENNGFDELLDYWRVYDQPETLWTTHDPTGTLAQEINSNETDGPRVEEILRGLLKIKKLLNNPSDALKTDGVHQEQLLCLTLLVKAWPMGIHLLLPFYLNPGVVGDDYTRPLKKIVAFWTLFRMIQTSRNTGRIQVAYLEPWIRSQDPETVRSIAMKDITLIDLERGLKRRLAACTQEAAVDHSMFTAGNTQLISIWSSISSSHQSTQSFVNKTILMFAYHNTIGQPPAEGYVPNISLAPANPHVDNRLTYSFFHSFVKDGDLEHIRPQKEDPNLSWPGVEAQYVQCIGNMHLAPKATNASLSNNGPKQKKFLYKYFAAQSPQDRQAIAGEMDGHGIIVGSTDQGVELRVDHTIFDLVFNYHSWDPEDLSQSIWNNAAIQDRSRAVCSRAVTNLLVWLNA